MRHARETNGAGKWGEYRAEWHAGSRQRLQHGASGGTERAQGGQRPGEVRGRATRSPAGRVSGTELRGVYTLMQLNFTCESHLLHAGALELTPSTSGCLALVVVLFPPRARLCESR